LTGYQDELESIEREIAYLGVTDPFAAPINPERLTRYIYRLYQRASLAGDLEQLSAAKRAIERAMPLLTHRGHLYLLRAYIAFKLHRLADVEAALLAIPMAGRCMKARLLRADLEFQYGHYREAEAGYVRAIEAERSWFGLVRVAYFRGKMGDLEDADRLYREAEDELTAKEMRSYAWREVQRGFLALSHGVSEQPAAARYWQGRALADYLHPRSAAKCITTTTLRTITPTWRRTAPRRSLGYGQICS
jgi:tetratricopeptide (TPR) repeat protein